VDLAKSVFVAPCSRKVYHNCDNPAACEIVLGDSASEIFASREDQIHEISRGETKELLRLAHARHLTQSIMHCGDHYYAICSCCSCCCVPTRLKQNFGIGRALERNPNVVRDFAQQLLD